MPSHYLPYSIAQKEVTGPAHTCDEIIQGHKYQRQDYGRVGEWREGGGHIAFYQMVHDIH